MHKSRRFLALHRKVFPQSRQPRGLPPQLQNAAIHELHLIIDQCKQKLLMCVLQDLIQILVLGNQQ